MTSHSRKSWLPVSPTGVRGLVKIYELVRDVALQKSSNTMEGPP
jgi:hypothetical protein